jgi:hypothetical protein
LISTFGRLRFMAIKRWWLLTVLAQHQVDRPAPTGLKGASVKRRVYRHTFLFVVLPFVFAFAPAPLHPIFAQTPLRTTPFLQSKAQTSPSTPPQLLRARKAYLVNNARDAHDAGGRQPFDDVSKALSRWRRWTLVERAETADIVVSLSTTSGGSSGLDRRRKTTPAEYQLSIQSKGASDSTLLWRGVDQKPADLVEQLRTQLDGPPTFCFALWCR